MFEGVYFIKGDTYERPEKGRRRIIELFPNNKIIMFPQTVYFSDTEEGKKQLEISKNIYNNHPNLVLIAREKPSYEFLKEHFTNAKIYLTPDIVLTLDEQKEIKREGALLVFRTDKEKVISDECIKEIENKISEVYDSFIYSDMSLGSGIVNIAGKYRDTILENKFKQFQSAEVAITDRLHGMIFAAITGTPCVVFGNFNHKIEKSYDWIKDLGYIFFCNKFEDFDEAFEKARKVEKKTYDNKFAKDMILKVLKDEINMEI